MLTKAELAALRMMIPWGIPEGCHDVTEPVLDALVAHGLAVRTTEETEFGLMDVWKGTDAGDAELLAVDGYNIDANDLEIIEDIPDPDEQRRWTAEEEWECILLAWWEKRGLVTGGGDRWGPWTITAKGCDVRDEACARLRGTPTKEVG